MASYDTVAVTDSGLWQPFTIILMHDDTSQVHAETVVAANVQEAFAEVVRLRELKGTDAFLIAAIPGEHVIAAPSGAANMIMLADDY